MTLATNISARTGATLGLGSSGTSPGTPHASPTVHLLGPGRVGRAFLRAIDSQGVRVVAVTDSRATAYQSDGFDPLALVAHFECGARVEALEGAQRLPADLAARLVRADVLVDATPTDLGQAGAALARVRAASSSGSTVALASKAALAVAADELLASGRVGANAALGGTGAALVRELSTLRDACVAVALVANASTTALIEGYERGEDRETALAAARARGVLEPDPTLDLDGTDLAIKLAIVARAVFGLPVRVEDIPRDDLRSLDPHLAWWRTQRGRTTRLVARASRDGDVRVALEEVARTSPLAAPSDRVAYAYALRDGRSRLHVGTGIGPRGTARALIADVRALGRAGVPVGAIALAGGVS